MTAAQLSRISSYTDARLMSSALSYDAALAGARLAYSRSEQQQLPSRSVVSAVTSSQKTLVLVTWPGGSPLTQATWGVFLGLCLSATLIVLIAAGLILAGLEWSAAREYCVVAVLVSFGLAGIFIQLRSMYDRHLAQPAVPVRALTLIKSSDSHVRTMPVKSITSSSDKAMPSACTAY